MNKYNEKQMLLSQKQRLIESTLFHLITPATIKKINQFFSTIKKDVRKEFKNEKR